MIESKARRKKKLVKPGFQLRLIGRFVGISALALLLQFLLLGYLLSRAVQGLEQGSAALAEAIPGIVIQTLAFSALVLLPLLFAFGVLLTFHIAGPVYRFETYLGALARGEAREPCKIREGDELQSLCDAINVLGETLRAREGSSEPDATAAQGERPGSVSLRRVS